LRAQLQLFLVVQRFRRSRRTLAAVALTRGGGSRGRCPPRTGQRQKLLLYHYFIPHHSHIFLYTRSVLWPRICRKCICRRGFAPDPTGELTTLSRPPSRLGRGHPFSDSTPLGASASTCLPLHIIPGHESVQQQYIIIAVNQWSCRQYH